MFYLAAAAPWPLLLASRHPAVILALGCLSVVCIAAGSLVRIARHEAALRAEQELESVVVEPDPATLALDRVIDDDVIRAVGTVEIVGAELLYELKSPNGRPLDPEFQRKLTVWLGVASKDLSQARNRLNELTEPMSAPGPPPAEIERPEPVL